MVVSHYFCNVVVTKLTTMKIIVRKALTIAFVLSLLQLTAQVPNGGFENWTLGDPDEWTANNVQGFVTPITQESPAHSGSFAAKGEVLSTIAGPLAPFLSSIDSNGQGFPVNQAYTAVNFYYKLSTTNTIFGVTVFMSDTMGAVVGSGAAGFTGTVSNFTPASIPITYFGGIPATCSILFLMGDTMSGNPSVGDFFIVDDVTLSTAPIGINPVPRGIATIYPNPASSSFDITLDEVLTQDAHVSVYDFQGRMVKEMVAIELGGSKINVPTGNLPNGIYTVLTVSGSKQWNSKLVVAR